MVQVRSRLIGRDSVKTHRESPASRVVVCGGGGSLVKGAGSAAMPTPLPFWEALTVVMCVLADV